MTPPKSRFGDAHTRSFWPDREGGGWEVKQVGGSEKRNTEIQTSIPTTQSNNKSLFTEIFRKQDYPRKSLTPLILHPVTWYEAREFHEPGFWHFLRSRCADSSSPQICAILFGPFTLENDSLRKSPQNLRNKYAEEDQNPGSQNSLYEAGRPTGRLPEEAARKRR